MKSQLLLKVACFVFAFALSVLLSSLSYAAQAVTIDNTTTNPVPVKPTGTIPTRDVSAVANPFAMKITGTSCTNQSSPDPVPSGKVFVVKTVSGTAFMSMGGTIHMSLFGFGYNTATDLEIPLTNTGFNATGEEVPFRCSAEHLRLI
jgi:hypothetical protein